MQVVHLHWKRTKMFGVGFDELLIPCSRLEVVAHLALSETGVRQLVKCDFREGYGPEDLSNSEYLTFESTLQADNGNSPIIVFNNHPLAIASIDFSDIAVLPPYTFSEEGISISVRGMPDGISKFLSLTQEIMPPDSIKVVNESDVDEGPKSLLGERQCEVVQAAVQWGYYDDPKGVSMRQMSERLKMARSTLGEHLHNAEATIMKWLVEQE
ncbi:MAG: helix-turn-helix domain-containing protein [Candidatus Thermoplasmatota archaeon]|nr:helix-turn-helix domain-containing protein [Candidatus Thermoplasmatota archaeon]